MQMSVFAGLSAVNITPEPGLPLMGNFRDDYAARGRHDPLVARAIVFGDPRGEKAAVLAVDICMLDRQNVARIREVIAQQCDVAPQNVLVHATHTHSAPAVCGRLGLTAEIAPHAHAIDTLLCKTASAVVRANRTLGEATFEIGYAREDQVSFNRRLRRHDGTTQMNWEALQPGFDPTQIVEAWGPVDTQIVCLTLRPKAGSLAALVNFGLHPAILAGDNWLYSADYPGYMMEALSRALGDGAKCLLLNGCCGDVNHIDYRDPLQGRGYPMAQRVGFRLARSAQRAIDSSKPIAASGLRVSREQVELKRQKISPRERERCEQIIERARQCPPRGQVDGLPDAYFARLRLEMWQVQDQPDFVEVMVIRLGDAAIVGLPGEAFCALGLEIKRRSPARHTLVAGLCNDAIGYLPTWEAFQQGGYETTVGSTCYEPDSAQRIVASAVGQLQRLFATIGNE